MFSDPEYSADSLPGVGGPNAVKIPWRSIVDTSEFKTLSSKIGYHPALWLVKATAYIESSWGKFLLSPTGARGVWQILPSTAKLLAAKYPLPPWSDEDIVTQARYALCHMINDYDLTKTKPLPGYIVAMLGAPTSSLHNTLLKMRAAYHLGPRMDVSPKLSYLEKERQRQEFKKTIIKYDALIRKSIV